jgi:hypothetical protein
VWLALMIWLSNKSLHEKNPVPIGEWQKREQGR